MLVFFTKDEESNSLNFKHIYDKYRNLIWYLICQRVRDEQLREDIMQEVLMKIFKSLGKFQSEAAVKSWIVIVTKNTAIDMNKKECNFKRYMQITLDDEDVINGCLGMLQDLPLDDVLKKEISAEISEVMNELKPIHHEVVTMYYFLEFTPKEIAQKLGIALDTVYSRLSRAKAILTDSINAYIKKNNLGGEADE